MSTTLVVVVMVMPMFALMAAMVAGVWWMRRDQRRDPLTTELLRLPGAGVAAQVDSISEAMLTNLFAAMLAGMAMLLMVLLRRIPSDTIVFDWIDAVTCLPAVLWCAWVTVKTLRSMTRLRRNAAGLRAERAAAQEIGAVLAGNNRLFHDVQAGTFNIDHVVVSPAGVFAVETKSRLKPPAGGGGDKVRVYYDGRALTFPGWVETEPIAQAGRQAKWLADYLRKATGESYSVTPVLALPGWWVENSAPITDGMVRAINPKNSKWLFLNPRGAGLDPAAIQRVSFAVEKLVVQESPANS